MIDSSTNNPSIIANRLMCVVLGIELASDESIQELLDWSEHTEYSDLVRKFIFDVKERWNEE